MSDEFPKPKPEAFVPIMPGAPTQHNIQTVNMVMVLGQAENCLLAALPMAQGCLDDMPHDVDESVIRGYTDLKEGIEGALTKIYAVREAIRYIMRINGMRTGTEERDH